MGKGLPIDLLYAFAFDLSLDSFLNDEKYLSSQVYITFVTFNKNLFCLLLYYPLSFEKQPYMDKRIFH